jgi:hypothetical protein
MPRLSDNLRTTYTTDGAVILDIAEGRIFRFNLTGSRVLRMLEAGRARDEIISALIREFSADPTQAELDTGEFLAILQSNRLVEP